MQARIQGWQSKFLSLAGRQTLVKSVLSSMPLHFLQAIKLPNWVYTEMDKIRRNFLWKGSDKCSGGSCLVNWELCTLPKRNGGLGITHLPTNNDALLVRWLWKLISEPESVWSKTVAQIYGTKDIYALSTSPRLSHTMKSLLQLSPLIAVSTQVDIASQAISWRWTTHKQYTAKSAYSVMRQPGSLSPYYKELWKMKTPPKVRSFMWLALLNRILTKEILHKRGWSADTNCILCNSDNIETVHHLLLDCTFTKQAYGLINSSLRPSGQDQTLQDHWHKIRSFQSQPLETIWLATIWNVWKERNHAIFQNSTPSVHRVAVRAIQDAALWSAHC